MTKFKDRKATAVTSRGDDQYNKSNSFSCVRRGDAVYVTPEWQEHKHTPRPADQYRDAMDGAYRG